MSTFVSTPTRAVAAVPSDTAFISSSSVLCQTAGNLVCQATDNAPATPVTVPMVVGQLLPFKVVQVLATGTTGTYLLLS